MGSNHQARRPIVRSASALRKHPIDMLHLARQAMGDPGLELEVLRVFDDVVRVNFARLERSTNAADLLTHLHTLTLAAGGVGAWSLVEETRALQVELEAGLPLNPERIDDIQMAVEELREFVAAQLESDDVLIH